jgi:hypothetical protein
VLWGAAEGFLFFIVPDVIISAVALRRGLRAGVLAALLAATGAAVGGAGMYLWSQARPDQARAAVAAVPAVSDAMIAQADADMTRGWLPAALKGPLTSTPYKVYAALAPAQGVSLPAWTAAAWPVRLPRFLFVAVCFAILGRVLRGRIPPRAQLVGFSLGWVLFYGWFWLSHPG